VPKCRGVNIEDVTIGALQDLMIAGRLTSRDLVSCYLARIEQTNEYVFIFSQAKTFVW